MACERYRDAISAIVDGEDPGVDEALVERHLEQCPSCSRFRALAEETRRAVAVDVAPEMPDLSRRVTKLAAIADRAGAWSTARAVLAVVAIQIIVFSVPDLLTSDADGMGAHDVRHLAAFTLAYGVALLVVVVRPARARAMLPVACVLAGALVVTAIVDLANGNVPLVNEVLHLPEIVSVVLVWALASPTRRRPTTRSQPVPPRLTVVDDHEQREAG